ncbi:MAG: histidinol-phosphate transaminase [Chloroflexi bacterium]|nr:histidinol-phosphate transaminase [Chloroflexota bacterium]
MERLVRPHLRSFQAYEPVDPPEVLAARAGIPPERVIKLDGNENPYGPSPRVLEALARLTGYNIYPDPFQRRVRQALATYAGVSPDQVIAGAGSDELIDLLLRLFLEPGDQVVDLSPTFGMYAFSTRVNGGQVVTVERDAAWEVDPVAVRRALTPRTKVVFVANPNNPTGNVTPQSVIEGLLEMGLVVVVDETYHEFSSFTVVPLLTKHENLVVLRTLSKWAGLAGLRIGYGIMAPQLAKLMMGVKAPYNINVAAEQAVLATLEDRDLLLRRVKAIVEERERLAAMLRRIPGLTVYSSRGNFLLVRLPQGKARQAQAGLAERGIFVRYFDAPRVADCLRISVGLPQHTEVVVKALAEIVKVS